MPNKMNDQETSLLQKHLARARDLGVEMDEYEEAYNVNFEELRAAESQPDLSEFVAVKFTPPSSPPSSALLTLTNHAGQQMTFHQWPPTELLQTLWSCDL